MSEMPSFVFVDSPAEFRDERALVVQIPSGIRSKQKLLGILADRLRFPAYFGWNWDALEECLRDLSWLPDGRSVVLVHEVLPFSPNGENRGIYLSVLADVTTVSPAQSKRRVRCVFRTADRDAVIPIASSPR